MNDLSINNISFVQLLEFVNKHPSRVWLTKNNKEFKVELTEKGIDIFPSSNIPRPVSFVMLDKFCTKFNNLKSFKPSSYHPSFVKSYLPIIVKEMLFPSNDYIYFDTDENTNEKPYFEGSQKQIYVNAYER